MKKNLNLNILIPVLLLFAAILGIVFYTKYHPKDPAIPDAVTVFPQAPSCVVDEKEKEEEQPKSDEDQGPFELTLKIRKGDTLMSILSEARIDKNEAHEVSTLLQKHFKAKDLKPHHEIYVTYMIDEKDPSKKLIESLYFRPNINTEYRIHVNENNEFVFEKTEIKLNKVTHLAQGKIRSSLYIDAGKEGVPVKILHQMIQAFSYDVDFQRSFQPGDEFSLLYTMNADEEGLREEAGDLLYASLSLKGKTLHIYRFKSSGGVGFYTQNGEGVKKGLLRTPIDGARISSKFGKRKHPILGYTKAHKGIDFAAPMGTPIMASGDGVVVQVGPYASYGNYIKIRHNAELSTAYAHLSRFVKGLCTGKNIKQGQIIGYVGTTGSSTGPHLHYELIRHNVQVDPASVTMMPTSKLGGVELQTFKNYKANLDSQRQTIGAEMIKAQTNPMTLEDQDSDENTDLNSEEEENLQEPLEPLLEENKEA